MRVAIVHDWLTGMRGGERCLEVFLSLFPGAEVFTLIYVPSKVTPIIREAKITPSALNELPKVENYYRYLLPLYPWAATDLSNKLRAAHEIKPFDLVISISHCLAKNVTAPLGVPHLCYCLTPVRYIWDQFEAYFGHKLERPLVKLLLPKFRRWDTQGATGVSSFAAISSFVQQRIKRYYDRESVVIFPPVRSDWIKPRAEGEVGRGFLCVNALVPYKNVDKIIEAFNRLGDELTIVGDGPERARLEAMAGPNIRFLRDLSDEQLSQLYNSSKALIFAAEEDFGMTPVEMQFAGRPVIAYRRGGALETVESKGPNPTGVHFSDLTTDAISAAVNFFKENEEAFTVSSCREKASQFSEQQFFRELQLWLQANLAHPSQLTSDVKKTLTNF